MTGTMSQSQRDARQEKYTLLSVGFLALAAMVLHIVSISGADVPWFFVRIYEDEHEDGELRYRFGLRQFYFYDDYTRYYAEYDQFPNVLSDKFYDAIHASLGLGIACIPLLALLVASYIIYATRQNHTILKNNVRIVKPIVSAILLICLALSIASFVQYHVAMKDAIVHDFCDPAYLEARTCVPDVGFYLTVSAAILTLIAAIIHMWFFSASAEVFSSPQMVAIAHSINME
eukprot:TRINITY_DN18953_c0_g1::TRINITY_DN18953_c0_g1_i1::g.21620::m.21620 TRINITY_DN18953_c0_g1::TRINITY_DN18953_c0_g1_i1::g.21620  ORF type:complete len:231 (+),score=30.65,Amastin/PF07344.6/3.9e+02,Amastin/PF07344.6/0.00063,Ion_trans/PF00520.26/0.31,DUF2975/PF11188.3/1.3e+03,DUF2975/PF11188.3/1.8,DUF2975/PF11188.3/3.5e+02 TRINITY_DN18953_c0_g1_i1:70-762(+)